MLIWTPKEKFFVQNSETNAAKIRHLDTVSAHAHGSLCLAPL